MSKQATPNFRAKSNVLPFTVDPTLVELGLVDRTNFDDVIEHERANNTALAAARAELAALPATGADPETAAKKAAELDQRISYLEAAVEASGKAGRKARSVLNRDTAAAYTSDEAIARAIAVDEAERDGSKAAEIAEAMTTVRSVLLAVSADRRFRRRCLLQQRAKITGKTPPDADWSRGGLDSTIEAALSTIETALAVYPSAGMVRAAIAKEDGWNEVAGIELDPAAYPAHVRDQITTGLDIQTSRRWLNGTTAPTPAPRRSGGFV